MASPTRYFAFGSNLWQHQMALRCPNSPFIGLARLHGYEWFINARGYANIAPTPTKTTATTPPNPNEDEKEEDPYATQVWGLVYALSPADEAQLDLNEGVPYAYQKEHLAGIDFWPSTTTAPTPTTTSSSTTPTVDITTTPPSQAEMLVYIDRYRNMGGHEPRAEYVSRMNRGIADALREGVPKGYVERVLRAYIPGEEEVLGRVVDVGLERAAMRRARGLDRDGAGEEKGEGGKGLPAAAAAAGGGPSGSGVVSRVGVEEEEELPERASRSRAGSVGSK
ncbi:hypothetical protein CHGG_06145 [Chaetomium globosum CBS 148.51]|uniref:gamma-glutamylcyclotransferase n=1 Tax=Chaetomium globosum (strain ATCC 6205 / CBS 148.51 / DSM 1962 / NBRC 6347 / NRRL 1970) TaxID=306901 RepID=Q2H5C0_CHAGB|nr:uncharacterized protein CHGG_06145 [Chaetomium globosum CBS 148.51]EAQ89526.1 hypothetical protein CHGG_06145 [Chaetomium globosum CBS 148.51]